MRFELPTPTTVKLVHLNVRPEKHGDESVTAVDLKFTMTCGNDRLDLFDPDLLTALYTRNESTESQGEIEGVPRIYPNLRFRKLVGLAWDDAIEGATVTIDYGLGGPGSNLRLDACKVNQFRIDCSEGGSVDYTWRVQTSSIPDGALDKLGKLLDGETQITLLRPTDGAGKVVELPAKPKGRAKSHQTTPEEALAGSTPH